MFNIELHMQTDTLEWLEPLARHLGHVEIALDYTNGPQPSREPHPVVAAIDEAERERLREQHRAKGKATYRAKLQSEAERKRRERDMMRTLSPKVIAAVMCPTCHSGIGRPCCGPSGTDFGFTGHTHFARREAYATQKETQK